MSQQQQAGSSPRRRKSPRFVINEGEIGDHDDADDDSHGVGEVAKRVDENNVKDDKDDDKGFRRSTVSINKERRNLADPSLQLIPSEMNNMADNTKCRGGFKIRGKSGTMMQDQDGDAKSGQNDFMSTPPPKSQWDIHGKKRSSSSRKRSMDFLESSTVASSFTNSSCPNVNTPDREESYVSSDTADSGLLVNKKTFSIRTTTRNAIRSKKNLKQQQRLMMSCETEKQRIKEDEKRSFFTTTSYNDNCGKKRAIISPTTISVPSLPLSSFPKTTRISMDGGGGWSLQDAITHICSVHNGLLRPIVDRFGYPTLYLNAGMSTDTSSTMSRDTNDMTTTLIKKTGAGAGATTPAEANETEVNSHIIDAPSPSPQAPVIEDAVDRDKYWTFRALCRVVTGQQLSGKCATIIWKRLLNITSEHYARPSATPCLGSISVANHCFLTPASLLHLVGIMVGDFDPINDVGAASHENNNEKGERGGAAAASSPSLWCCSFSRENDNTTITTTAKIRKLIGLSQSKMNAIIDLAKHYIRGDLYDEFFHLHDIFEHQQQLLGRSGRDAKRILSSSLSPTATIVGNNGLAHPAMQLLRHSDTIDLINDQHNNSDSNYDVIRERLLQVKGIGPWSVDVFFMFFLHHPNILPLGDLGVRKGTGILFGLVRGGKLKNCKTGGASGGRAGNILCEKKDAALLRSLHEPFAPYHSVSTYYMWKIADTDLWN